MSPLRGEPMGMLRRALLAACLLTALAPVPSGADVVVDRSANVEVVGRHAYVGGTEIGFADGYVYAGQMNGQTQRGSHPGQGGVFIYDVSEGFQLAGQLYCPGNDNYVAAVRPGLVVVAHHTSRLEDSSPSCNGVTRGNGIFLADVSDPTSPKVLGSLDVSSGHTLTVHPSGDYVYVSPGGLANGDLREYIIDIRNPSAPRLASTFLGSVAGCHDLGFDIRPERFPFPDLAFCAGGGEIQTWDVSDPENPVVIGRTTNPAIQFPHNAQVSPDGRKLVINDEAFGLHECQSGTSLYGSLWIYDITVPAAPVPVGRIAPPTSRSTLGTWGGWSNSWCAAHNYNFIPGTDYVVTAWFTGGTTVHDISNPLLPELVAWYKASDGTAYTAHWFEGRIYVNDSNRGMEVLEVDGLAQGPADGPSRTVSWPRIDRTSQLLPAILPPRPVPPADRTAEGSLFCIIPRSPL